MTKILDSDILPVLKCSGDAALTVATSYTRQAHSSRYGTERMSGCRTTSRSSYILAESRVLDTSFLIASAYWLRLGNSRQHQQRDVFLGASLNLEFAVLPVFELSEKQYLSISITSRLTFNVSREDFMSSGRFEQYAIVERYHTVRARW